jgi:hypothetical protein
MVAALLALPGAQPEEPASVEAIDAAQGRLGGSLPEPYREFLLATNGLTLLDHHLRLLGAADLVRWNDAETWKHAWPRPPLDFICFGGTSIGDQWAWRLADLRISKDAAVTALDGFELAAAPIAASTTSFLRDVLPALATTQIDDLVALAHQRIGPLPKDSLLIAAPPAQFGVEGLVNRMRPMFDAGVMTTLGDVARQLEGQAGRRVTRFDTVIDDQGRPRLKLTFE